MFLAENLDFQTKVVVCRPGILLLKQPREMKSIKEK